MADHWDDIGQAIATKMRTSALLIAAGLKGAEVSEDQGSDASPKIRVLQPDFEMIGHTANESGYFLRFPFELLVPKPSGTVRSGPRAAALMRALQEEWRIAVKLGMGTLVVSSELVAATRGLEAFAESGQDGYRGVISVQCHETHSPITA